MSVLRSGDPDGCRLIPIGDPSAVAAARRVAAELAAQRGLSETDVGRVALLVTEAATNIVKHAGQGEILIRALPGETPALEILAIDSGPGVASERLLADGYSSTGTLGMGLGTMRRLSTDFDLYSRADRGTVIRLEVRAAEAPSTTTAGFVYGVVAVALPGEPVSGDAWVVREQAGAVLVAVVDGLGHGFLANDASLAAVSLVDRAHEAPGALLSRMHEKLRSTRGAAAAVAAAGDGRLRYAGVGNIAGRLIQADRARSLLSHNGIVGHNARRFPETQHAYVPGDLLVMASDGLGTHWSLDDYPGLSDHHPAVIAAVLYRDHSRRRDDLVVVVGKLAS